MRKIFIILGTVTLAGLWMGPLPGLAAHSFAAHMGLHMGVVAIAAGFLAIGLAGTRFDLTRSIPRVASPIPASLVELAVVWIWHAPVLHHFARHSPIGLFLEQGTFLASGYLLWISAFGDPDEKDGNRSSAGIIGLLLTSMHMTLLGALLALTPRALYSHNGDGEFALDALQDQHLGGAIMLLVGGVSYLAGGLWLTVALLRHSGVRLRVET